MSASWNRRRGFLFLALIADRNLRVDIQRGDHAGDEYEPKGKVKKIH
jgi:hypothetical protein